MSQIEQQFRQMLSSKPEIAKCYQEGLVNRRALARYLIQTQIAPKNQFDAVVAMLRRFPFEEYTQNQKEALALFKTARITLKDNIVILDFKKDKQILQKLQKIISHINYDAGDTLKIVLGTSSVKVFIDQKNLELLKESLEDFTLKSTIKKISEISLQFSDDAMRTKGVVSIISAELLLHNIVITELLTASPELLVYVKEEYVLKAYEVVKSLQK